MAAKDLREHLIGALDADLVGPYADDEVLPLPPSRWYLTGFLVPRSGREAEQDPIRKDDANCPDDCP